MQHKCKTCKYATPFYSTRSDGVNVLMGFTCKNVYFLEGVKLGREFGCVYWNKVCKKAPKILDNFLGDKNCNQENQ